jgi:hypothetical protein
LLQAINFEEIKGTIEKDKLFVEGVVFRLNSENKFGFIERLANRFYG